MNNDKPKRRQMKVPVFTLENRTARLTLLIDPNKKSAFEDLCDRLDTTPSQAMRQMIRDFLLHHNVAWTPGDESADDK